ncbi:hypothetical protein RvY_17750 [Ramazzottius varieornatus]|uniref:Uncharacterized protein n=1 Tax=Ramazzottius varieornatus TaxID=947166 RepID=A0A1D1W5A5_RAMVA|nr:hypothetical protein RvY_17750 [Ramazzottius varieornatus]
MGMPLLGTVAQPRSTADRPPPNLATATIKPTRLQVSQASVLHHAAAAAENVASVGRPDVNIDLGSIGSPRKPFDRRRLGNHPPHQRISESEVEATVEVVELMAARMDAAVVEGTVVAVGHNEHTTFDVVDTREVNVILGGNGEPAQGTMEEDGRRMAIRTSTRQTRRASVRRYYKIRRGPSRRTAKAQRRIWTSSSIKPGTRKPVGHRHGQPLTMEEAVD